jgi:AraC-like DNA-binding protein
MIVYSSASRLRQTAATKETPSAVQVRKRREVGVDKNPYDTEKRDRLMREMCRAGSTTAEIAEALGYSTPAAASRRMRQLGLIAAKKE